MEAPEVLDSLRSGADRVEFPVIILTGARSSASDQVVTIERGATDYIVKGTDRQVLLARIRSALRDRRASSSMVTRGRLRVDPVRGVAWLGERPLLLERRPMRMLALLAEHAGENVARAKLLEEVWGSSYPGFEHTLEQAVHQVRRELREPGWLVT